MGSSLSGQASKPDWAANPMPSSLAASSLRPQDEQNAVTPMPEIPANETEQTQPTQKTNRTEPNHTTAATPLLRHEPATNPPRILDTRA